MCRNGRGFRSAVFAAALVGADVVLVNTDFRIDALAAAMSAHQIDNDDRRKTNSPAECMTADEAVDGYRPC